MPALLLTALSLARLSIVEPFSEAHFTETSFCETEDCAAKATILGSPTTNTIAKETKNNWKILHRFSMAWLPPKIGVAETLAKLIEYLGEDIATY